MVGRNDGKLDESFIEQEVGGTKVSERTEGCTSCNGSSGVTRAGRAGRAVARFLGKIGPLPSKPPEIPINDFNRLWKRLTHQGWTCFGIADSMKGSTLETGQQNGERDGGTDIFRLGFMDIGSAGLPRYAGTRERGDVPPPQHGSGGDGGWEKRQQITQPQLVMKSMIKSPARCRSI